MNNWLCSGTVIKPPEFRENPLTSKAIAHFTLAVRRNNSKNVDYFTFTAFNDTAIFVNKYVKRGTRLSVIAQVTNDNYKDKNGQMKYDYDFTTNQIEIMNSGKYYKSKKRYKGKSKELNKIIKSDIDNDNIQEPKSEN